MTLEEACGAVLQATAALGIAAALDERGAVLDIDGVRVPLRVHAAALLTAQDVARVPDDALVVADRVVADARNLLRQRRVSWLDRRGHLYVSAPGVRIDTEIPTQRPAPGRTAAFAGAAGRDIACALLLDPARPLGVRDVARTVGRAPSTVSQVLRSLSDEGLLRGDGTPLLPDLFWAVAEAWRPRVVTLGALPREGAVADILQVNRDDLERPGWALGDTVAAAAYGAPVAAPASHPPDFHVPSSFVLQQVETLLVAAPPSGSALATARVAPTRLVCTTRRDGVKRSNEWPLAHPLFVALDLATDPDRGRQVVEQWDPPEWVTRVW